MAQVRFKAPTFCYVVLILVISVLYFPLVHMIWGSVFVEGKLSLVWYQQIIADNVLIDALKRSFLIAIGNGFVSVVLGSLIAIALARTNFRYKRQLHLFALISLGIPELVFALSLLSWFFILKWQLSLLTVLVAHTTFSLSFVAFTVHSQLVQIEKNLEEAAQDLGASTMQVLWFVILPILKPALLAGFFLGFLLSFDDFLITFFTSGVGVDTLPVKLYSAMRLGSSPKLNAMAALMILISAVALYVLSRSVKKLKA